MVEMKVQVEMYKRTCGRKKTQYQALRAKHDADLQRYTREGNAKAGAYSLMLVKKTARAIDEIDKDIQTADTFFLEVSGADDLQKMAALQGVTARAFREVNGKLSVTQMSRTTHRLTQQLETLKSKAEMINETNDDLREGMLADGDGDGDGAGTDIQAEYDEYIRMQHDLDQMNMSESSASVVKKTPMQLLADQLFPEEKEKTDEPVSEKGK